MSLCGGCHDQLHHHVSHPEYWSPPNYAGKCDDSDHWYPETPEEHRQVTQRRPRIPADLERQHRTTEDDIEF